MICGIGPGWQVCDILVQSAYMYIDNLVSVQYSVHSYNADYIDEDKHFNI